MTTVDIHKFRHMMFYSPQSIGPQYVKSGLHGHLKAISRLPARIEGKTSFIVASMTKSSLKFAETKGGIGTISFDRKPAYLQMPFVSRQQLFEGRIEHLEEQFNNLVSSTWGYLFTERDIKKMGELSKGMLEGSKKMRELAEQLQEVEDED